MKTLEEIKILFENRSYDVRSDFINEYDFEDEYLDYYRQFIINARNIKDHLYLSDLIDLAGTLGFYEKELRDRYYSYLFDKRHYLVKIAVLDYFNYCRLELLPSSYENDLNLLSHKNVISLVKTQLLFNLIRLNSDRKEIYKEHLKKSLNNSNDWRAFYRILMNIKQVKIDNTDKIIIYDHIRIMSLKKDLGEGTEILLKELYSIFHPIKTE